MIQLGQKVHRVSEKEISTGGVLRVKSAAELQQESSCIILSEIRNLRFDHVDATPGSRLRHLLSNTTGGKSILQKSTLEPKDSRFIVAALVEAELLKLNNIRDTIRGQVWEQWVSEISALFPDEDTELFYTPFSIVEGRAFQASGLIPNRLITVRRKLTQAELVGNKKRSNIQTNDNRKKRATDEEQRLRPLPEAFSYSALSTEKDEEECSDSLEWLCRSSTPENVLLEKWMKTLKERNELLKIHGYEKWLEDFRGLQAPQGYLLLVSDFDVLYEEAAHKFPDKFALVKPKILQLLHEKAKGRGDRVIDELVSLSTIGEEESNAACFLAIPQLLSRLHTFTMKDMRAPINPSRKQVANSFLSKVSTCADIEGHRIQRKADHLKYKEPFIPYVLAVGEDWQNIQQYHIILNENVQYAFTEITKAFETLFKILWVIDIPYPKESQPVWMFLQLAIFEMKTKCDAKGTAVLELVNLVKKRYLES